MVMLCKIVVATSIAKPDFMTPTCSVESSSGYNYCSNKLNIPYHIIIMPLYFSKNQIISPKKLESSSNQSIYNKLSTLTDGIIELHQHDSFTLESSSLTPTVWQNEAKSLKATLQTVHLNESVEIPSKYLPTVTTESQFIMIGYLQNLSFSEYNDRIPYTYLTSIVHDFFIHIQYYIVSIPQKILVAKFTTTGHSSTSTLILTSTESTTSNYSYSSNLINDAFYDLTNNINNYLTNTPIIPTKKIIINQLNH